MNQLADQLQDANRVCEKANQYFEEARDILDEERRKRNIAKGFIYGFVFVGIAAFVWCQLMSRWPLVYASIPLFLGGVVIFAADAIFDKNSPKVLKKAETYNKKGKQLITENESVLSIIPDDYWYPLATNYLYKAIAYGRADSIKEALQLYDEQLHRWKMEEASSNIARQLEKQIRALQSISTSVDANTASRYFTRLR